eukprot:826200-Lingulodinium_polyedra.AAC.1
MEVSVLPIAGDLSDEDRARMQYLVVHAGRGRALHVVQVYGWSEGERAAADNAALVMAAVAWVRSLGDVPALVVGDFNATVQSMGIDG